MGDPIDGSGQLTRTPSLGELLEHAIATGLDNARVSLPAKIASYDPATQTASVEPLVCVYERAPDGSRKAVALPMPQRVPVIFPGAGGFRITFPVQVGDTVLLVFADRSLDQWKSKGGANGAVDPLDVRSHHLADAVAVVGLHDLLTPWTGAATDGLTLGKDGGPQIKVTTDEVRLGDVAATQKAILGDNFLADLSQLVTDIASAVSGIPTGGAAAGALITAALAKFTAGSPAPYVGGHTSATVRIGA